MRRLSVVTVGWVCAGLILALACAGCAGERTEEGEITLILPTASPTVRERKTLPPSPTEAIQPVTAFWSTHPWPMVDGSPRRTRHSGAAGPPVAAQVLWTFDLGEEVLAEPVVAADGTVYVATQPGVLTAVSPQGEQVWRFSAGTPLFYAPALSENGTVYLATGKPQRTGAVIALDASTGSEGWRHALSPDYGPISPLLLDGEANLVLAVSRIVWGDTGYLLSLRSDGEQRWTALSTVPRDARLLLDSAGRIWLGGYVSRYPPQALTWSVGADDGAMLHRLSPGGNPYLDPAGALYLAHMQWVDTVDEAGNAVRRTRVDLSQVGVGPGGQIRQSALDDEAAYRLSLVVPWWGFSPIGHEAVLRHPVWDGEGTRFGYLQEWGSVAEEGPATLMPGASPTAATGQEVVLAAVQENEIVWSLALTLPDITLPARPDMGEPQPALYTPLALGEGRLYFCTYAGVLYAVGQGETTP